MALDPSGNLVILDQCDNQVLRLNSSGVTLSTWPAGSYSGYNVLLAIAVNAQSQIFISDQKNIYVYSAGGTLISQLTGSNFPNNPFDTPYSMAFDNSGALYTATDFINLILNTNFQVLRQWNPGYFPPLNTNMYGPQGIAVDSSGNIYVSLTDMGIVRKYKPNFTPQSP